MDVNQLIQSMTSSDPSVKQPLLTPAHFDVIEGAERKLHDLLPELDKAQSCDVPGCEEMRARARQLLAKLGKFKATYFPQGRP